MLILKIHNKYKIYLELFKNVSVLVGSSTELSVLIDLT